MEALRSEWEGMPLVVVHGEIDHANMADFARALEPLVEDGAQRLIVDLRDVTYIDSGGLSVIYSVLRRLPEDGWLGAVGARSDVRRILEIGGLTGHAAFRLFPSLDEVRGALAS